MPPDGQKVEKRCTKKNPCSPKLIKKNEHWIHEDAYDLRPDSVGLEPPFKGNSGAFGAVPKRCLGPGITIDFTKRLGDNVIITTKKTLMKLVFIGGFFFLGPK
ncbi:MAG: hypothetical protein AAB646_03080 [Patescibacteria group bacterium]